MIYNNWFATAYLGSCVVFQYILAVTNPTSYQAFVIPFPYHIHMPLSMRLPCFPLNLCLCDDKTTWIEQKGSRLFVRNETFHQFLQVLIKTRFFIVFPIFWRYLVSHDSDKLYFVNLRLSYFPLLNLGIMYELIASTCFVRVFNRLMISVSSMLPLLALGYIC